MDVILSFVLVVIAVCLVLQRPIQIQITHKHEIVPQPIATVDPVQKEIDKEAQATMDNVISTIQEIMGVDKDANYNRPA